MRVKCSPMHPKSQVFKKVKIFVSEVDPVVSKMLLRLYRPYLWHILTPYRHAYLKVGPRSFFTAHKSEYSARIVVKMILISQVDVKLVLIKFLFSVNCYPHDWRCDVASDSS